MLFSINKLNYISYLPLAPLVCQHDQNQRAISLHRDYLNLMNTGNFSAVLFLATLDLIVVSLEQRQRA